MHLVEAHFVEHEREVERDNGRVRRRGEQNQVCSTAVSLSSVAHTFHRHALQTEHGGAHLSCAQTKGLALHRQFRLFKVAQPLECVYADRTCQIMERTEGSRCDSKLAGGYDGERSGGEGGGLCSRLSENARARSATTLHEHLKSRRAHQTENRSPLHSSALC